MHNAITSLVGEELEGLIDLSGIMAAGGEQLEEGSKWIGTLATPNGYLYGIPCYARRVGKFNPVGKSFTHIGPDLGNGYKWVRGAITDCGIIYCVPFYTRGNGSRLTRTSILSQNWIEIFFHNKVL